MPGEKLKAGSNAKPDAGKSAPTQTESRKRPGGEAGSAAKQSFHIAAIGASAGGLEAISSFLDGMPEKIPDIAFVVVSHLDPNHPSILPDLLQRHTSLEVASVTDGVEVQPRKVYVIPPHNDLEFDHGRLRLLRFQQVSESRTPINHFFRSLAEGKGEMAIGIILSGMGSDGSDGIRAIKDELGMVMVQEPGTAKYDGMPRSALGTGLVDFVLHSEDMPGYLFDYVERMLKTEPDSEENMPPGALNRAHHILRARTGHDFSHYKESTVRRRIARRMKLHAIDHVADYIHFLRNDPSEAQALIKELLIGVTRFFRDPEAFETLKKTALPKILQDKPAGYTIRAWVVGCASGEEAYSLAIVLREYLAEKKLDLNIQIFATDLDEDAINHARAGRYPADTAADVSPERLHRFFKQENGGYRVSLDIREVIVFAKQSVLKDPPFGNVDLLCCRNLLIYLDASIQKKLLPLFHYSLKPGGILFLGPSETIGQFVNLFNTLDNHWKVFQRAPGTSSLLYVGNFPLKVPKVPLEDSLRPRPGGLAAVLERTLLDEHTPVALVMDAKGNIRYIHGRVGRYLEHPKGSITGYNALEMARKGLKLHLIATMRKMEPNAKPSREVVQIEQEEGAIQVQVTVRPMPQNEAPELYVALLEEVSVAKGLQRKETKQGAAQRRSPSRVRALEEELVNTRDKLRAAVEELESSNEELRAGNEEYQSTNEELQSANEELNSSKEELQSLNEELETVNSELQGKVKQIEEAYDDMGRMLNSLKLPTIFLDGKLCIRRFSEQASEMVDLIDSDLGRPLEQLSSKLEGIDLSGEARQVLVTRERVVKKVKTRDGRPRLLRILPYEDQQVSQSGVVLTLLDITI